MHLNNNKHVNQGVKIFAKEVMNDKDSGHALQSVYAKNKTIGRCAAVFRRKICVFKYKFVPLLAFCAAYRLTIYRFSGAQKQKLTINLNKLNKHYGKSLRDRFRTYPRFV